MRCEQAGQSNWANPMASAPDRYVKIGNRAHPVHFLRISQMHAALMCMGSTIDSIYWRSKHDVACIATYRPPFAGWPGGILLGFSAAANAAELQP